MTIYAALALFDQKRFEICEIQCEPVPKQDGVYKILNKELTIPHDRNKNATAITQKMMNKRIYLNKSTDVNFVYYSFDRDECLLELLNCKKAYNDLQVSLIKKCKDEMATLQKRIDKYRKRIETFDETFVVKPVDNLVNWKE